MKVKAGGNRGPRREASRKWGAVGSGWDGRDGAKKMQGPKKRTSGLVHTEAVPSWEQNYTLRVAALISLFERLKGRTDEWKFQRKAGRPVRDDR